MKRAKMHICAGNMCYFEFKQIVLAQISAQCETLIYIKNNQNQNIFIDNILLAFKLFGDT